LWVHHKHAEDWHDHADANHSHGGSAEAQQLASTTHRDRTPWLTSASARHTHVQERFQRAATRALTFTAALHRAPAPTVPPVCEPPSTAPIAPRSRGPPPSHSC
jgi:hypothetical protein